ncbi:MAG: hypothetical protein RIQ53_2835 [Pseudomonadota bacterium]|jgi:hypothetical protein
MSVRCIQLPQIQNFNPSSRATLRLPLGAVYEKLYIYLGTTGVTKAIISNIVLKLNNKELQRWSTVADLDILNGYKGNASNGAFLLLDFTERLAKQEAGAKFGAIAACQEAGVQDFTVEFDIGNFTPVAGNAPTAYADINDASSNRVVTRVQYAQRTIAGAAVENIYVPFGAAGYQIKRLIIKGNQLKSVKIRRDSVDIWEDLPAHLVTFRAQDFGRMPQAGCQVVDFMPDTLLSNVLNTVFTLGGDGAPVAVSNLDIRVTTAAADTVTVYTEGYALLNLL